MKVFKRLLKLNMIGKTWHSDLSPESQFDVRAIRNTKIGWWSSATSVPNGSTLSASVLTVPISPASISVRSATQSSNSYTTGTYLTFVEFGSFSGKCFLLSCWDQNFVSRYKDIISSYSKNFLSYVVKTAPSMLLNISLLRIRILNLLIKVS